jgi:hypoxanthine phosphoribosyltransferase
MQQSIRLKDLEFQPFIGEEKLQARIAAMGAQLTKDFEGKKPLFIAVLIGSYVFASDLLKHFKGDCELVFIRFSSYEGTQSSGKIKTVLGLNSEIRDRHVVVLEDIIDSGNTMAHLMQQLEERQPASITLTTLLFKPTALEHPLQIDYVGFAIPEAFVVGYGMDYEELGRNLPEIYQLKQADNA